MPLPRFQNLLQQRAGLAEKQYGFRQAAKAEQRQADVDDLARQINQAKLAQLGAQQERSAGIDAAISGLYSPQEVQVPRQTVYQGPVQPQGETVGINVPGTPSAQEITAALAPFGQEGMKVAKSLIPKEEDSKNFDREEKLRNRFLKQSEDYVKQRDAFGRIQASAQDPSAAGDLALIFNYMKVLDPGSTVREGEFANAENSASVPNRLRNIYNKVLTGQRLGESQRVDFVNRASRLFSAADKQHQKRINQFTSLAERNKLSPENIVLDIGLEGGIPEEQPIPEEAPEESTASASRVIDGVRYEMIDGDWYEVQ